jgi:hypothetical protein
VKRLAGETLVLRENLISAVLSTTNPIRPSSRFNSVIRLKTLPTTFQFLLVSCGGVRLSPVGMSDTIWPIVPAPDDG